MGVIRKLLLCFQEWIKRNALFNNAFCEQLSSPLELKSDSRNYHQKNNEGRSSPLWDPTDKQRLLEAISRSEIVRVSFSQNNHITSSPVLKIAFEPALLEILEMLDYALFTLKLEEKTVQCKWNSSWVKNTGTRLPHSWFSTWFGRFKAFR